MSFIKNEEGIDMSIKLGLIMLLSLVPIILLLFWVLYPKNWRKRKYIFGVSNRDEYKAQETEKSVDEIVQRIRKQALYITISSIIIAVALLFIPNTMMMMLIYTIYIFVVLFVCAIPYVKGNSEMKSLKRELGIKAKGVKVADLKSINASHALNMPMLLIPNVLTAVGMVIALLYDFNVIGGPKDNSLQGSYAATIMVGSFFFMAILFVLLAKMMDNMRNEVISEESDVNANYNRAKKKTWNDTWIQLSWLNTVSTYVSFLMLGSVWSENMVIILSIVYLLATIVIIGLLARKTSKLNKSYEFEKTFDDDDDFWICGLFYCNPNDKRLNVEKRDGMGATINMSHPLGKVITVIIVLALIGSIGSVIWAAVSDVTDIDVKVENGNVICHHLRNDYVIPLSDIEEVSLGENFEELDYARIAGTATEKLCKGRFAVSGDKNARLFMNRQVGMYIRIKTDKYIYYINDNSVEETKEVFNAIESK